MTNKIKLAAVLFFFVLVGAVVVKHPCLRANVIEFKGNNVISSETLQLFSQPYLGQHVLFLKGFGCLERTLLDHFPSLDEVHVGYRGSGKLTVTLSEKLPWVMFVVDGESIAVARDGTLLNRDGNSHIPNLKDIMIIKGFSTVYFQGETLNHVVLDQVERLSQEIKKNYNQDDLQIDFQDETDWVIYKNDTLPIMMGDLMRLEEKFDLLSRFFKDYQKRRTKRSIAYIDLRVPSKLLVSYEKTL